MKRIILLLAALLSPSVVMAQEFEPYKPQIIGPGVQVYTYTETPLSEEEELKDIQVPVPRKDRVINTKGNCVWCSLELLGRFAEIKQLYNITLNPRNGGDPACQGGSWDGPVRAFLNKRKIRYEMVTDRRRTDFLVRGCKIERRGVAFDIPGHMLTLVHYDPDTKIIKVIDNADRSLSVQTWSWEKFHRLWAGWAYIIYAEPDIIPYKYVSLANRIPIKHRNGTPATPLDKHYIPMPKTKDD